MSKDDKECLRILVVDDHSLVLEFTAAGLSAQDGFFCEMASDVDVAIRQIKEKGRYDVILLDYQLPGVKGLQGLRTLVSENNGGVALFSGVVGWSIVETAIKEGASGFIPKTIQLKTLYHAIRFIAEDGLYLPAEYVRYVSTGAPTNFNLKGRETQVLGFLIEGMTNKEIGREVGIPEVIVKMDVKSICRKLGVKNRTEAAIFAQRHGIDKISTAGGPFEQAI